MTAVAATSITEHHFYGGVIRAIATELGWAESRILTESAELPPSGWWNEFVQRELPERVDRPTVVFLDEVDSVRRLDFEPDALFTSIRSAVNYPTDRGASVTFCLIGTMTAREILRTPTATPFNVGVDVPLEDFTYDEAAGFLPGLQRLGGNAESILRDVMSWTSGHPFLTQRVCAALIGHASPDVAAAVRELLQQRSDPLFSNTEDTFDLYASGAAGHELVELYGKVLHGQAVELDANSRAQIELRVTGMAAIRDVGGKRALAVRNKIYTQQFDDHWLTRRRMHRYLAAAVARWRDSDHGKGFLHGADLAEAVEWATSQERVSGEELAFLLASKEIAERARGRSTKLWRIGFAVSATSLLVFAFLLVISSQRLARIKDERDAQRATVGSLTRSIDSLKSKHDSERQALQAQIDDATALAAGRQKTLNEIQANLDSFRKTLDEIRRAKQQDQSKYQLRLSTLLQQLDSATNTAKQAQSDYLVLQNRATELEVAAQREKAAADAAGRQAQAAADAPRRAELEKATLAQQLEQVKLALGDAQTRAQVLETARSSAEQALATAKTQLASTQATAQTQLDAEKVQHAADLGTMCQQLATLNAPVPKPPCP